MLIKFIMPNTYIDSIPNSIGLLHNRTDGERIDEIEYNEIIGSNELLDYSEDYNVFISSKDNNKHIIILQQ